MNLGGITMINRVVLVGRLVRDPELRKTAANQSVTNFSIAVDNRFARDKERSASFFNVVCWNQTADFVAQYVRKGQLVGVDGRLEQRSYENNAGQRVNIIEVIADSVQSLGPTPESSEETGYQADNEPASDLGEGVDISDDDLPF
jgi:single-strand DNA-binding protein